MGGVWLTPRPGRFTSGKKDLVLVVQEVGWTPGPIWAVVENIVHSALNGYTWTGN